MSPKLQQHIAAVLAPHYPAVRVRSDYDSSSGTFTAEIKSGEDVLVNASGTDPVAVLAVAIAECERKAREKQPEWFEARFKAFRDQLNAEFDGGIAAMRAAAGG